MLKSNRQPMLKSNRRLKPNRQALKPNRQLVLTLTNQLPLRRPPCPSTAEPSDTSVAI
jgi:hypothetical protein